MGRDDAVKAMDGRSRWKDHPPTPLYCPSPSGKLYEIYDDQLLIERLLRPMKRTLGYSIKGRLIKERRIRVPGGERRPGEINRFGRQGSFAQL